jgi:hypothetical protein
VKQLPEINPPHARTGEAGGATQCQERMIVGLVDNEYPIGSIASRGDYC